ncbi:membrane protein [Acrocarpospora phusangensis]|uniref:Membrane protein n=1 Tax=Acrocarpospora phusangensis TaxID=1070424 RepID=A0A919UM01_9ACTN|nr:extracellular solute-binding protein [Acrocarpospora phusangensis]GIH22772.1 membrane protein [Acrocarpospora phusangensis]
MSDTTLTTLSGLTWDHPRGYGPLERLSRDGAPVRWTRQPLHGFESEPIHDLARRHDLLVIDHPGLGAAVRHSALRPVDSLLDADELMAIRAAGVGASYDSYSLDGTQWALPIDAAAQVSVIRPDRFSGPPPATWAEVAQTVRTTPTALCLGGPHAFLMFSAICVAAGEEPGRTPDGYVSRDIGRAVFELMAELAGHSDRGLAGADPIGVLAAMEGDDGPAYCPLVYGYVNYQGTLRAGSAPAWTPDGRPGSVLGGTGVAVSAYCARPDLAARELRRLVSPRVQREVFPASGGQPAALAAWTDPGVNAAAHGFYREIASTVAAAWVRPRFDGFIGFQATASRLLREALLDGSPPDRTLDGIDERFRAAREGASR